MSLTAAYLLLSLRLSTSRHRVRRAASAADAGRGPPEPAGLGHVHRREVTGEGLLRPPVAPRPRDARHAPRSPTASSGAPGANEPTIFYTPVALQVAGIRVPPGVYSLYTVPGKSEWEVIVNRSITQWGHESRYTDSVKAQEVGRGKAPAQATRRADRDLHHPGGAGQRAEARPSCSSGRRPG